MNKVILPAVSSLTWIFFFLSFVIFLVGTNFALLGSHGGLSSVRRPVLTDWKRYTDNEHGFSLEIPSQWEGKLGQLEFSEKQGKFVVHVQDLDPCVTSTDYFKSEISPCPLITTIPLGNDKLDGFIVTGLHLDNITPGPEALIFNGSRLIRLGFDPTGIQSSDEIFSHIVSSVTVWPTIETLTCTKSKVN